MPLKAIAPGPAWLQLGIHVPAMGEEESWSWGREQPLSLAPAQGMHEQSTGIVVCLGLDTGHSSCKQGAEPDGLSHDRCPTSSPFGYFQKVHQSGWADKGTCSWLGHGSIYEY